MEVRILNWPFLCRLMRRTIKNNNLPIVNSLWTILSPFPEPNVLLGWCERKMEILRNQVIITKDKRGKNNCRKYGQHHFMATTSLNVRFGVAKHSVPTSREGKVNSGNTHYRIIQKMFCGNNDKV